MDYISGRNERSKKDIPLNKIIFITANDDDVYIKTLEGYFKILEKLYYFEESTKLGFLRVSKSFVVNITKIRELSPLFNSKIKLRMIDGELIYVNRTYVRNFKEFIKKGVV
ncbi:LytTR family transcriptional regulator [Mycoplasmatota bacterium]|nr:LytTR family transcriptional regulator [Mycoplasmatota bacterium]